LHRRLPDRRLVAAGHGRDPRAAARGRPHRGPLERRGGDYARERALQHGVAHLVDATYGKQTRAEDGRWSLTDFADVHRPSVLVDDRPEDAPHDLEIIAVSPYIAPDVHDRGLHRVMTSVPDPDVAMEAS
jgi:hypothetical protein